METKDKDTTQDRVRARDAAMHLLSRLTTGAAVSAVVGVGLFGAFSAYTIPGTSTASAASQHLGHVELLVIHFDQHLVRAPIVEHPGHQLFQLWSGGLGRILIA